MAEEISIADIEAQYYKTLILYKGEPAFFNGMDGRKEIQLIMLRTGEKKEVEFNLKDFRPPTMRIGLVNAHGNCVYVTRQPYRKYQVGMSNANMNFNLLVGYEEYIESAGKCLKWAQKLSNKEVADAMDNKYPTFEQCLIAVRKEAKVMAFDHQFAIDRKLRIYYKTKVVGTLPAKGKTVEDIVFADGCEHLFMLIGDNCAKSLRDSRTAQAH